MRVGCGKINENTEAGMRYAYWVKIILFSLITLVVGIFYFRFYYPLSRTSLY